MFFTSTKCREIYSSW